MPVPFTVQHARTVTAPDGQVWTVRVVRDGVDDPPMRFFIGPGYWLAFVSRRLSYMLRRSSAWRVRVHSGRESPGGAYGPAVLDELRPTPEAAAARAEELATTLANGGWHAP